MRFRFRTKRLASLYASEVGAKRYPTGVVDAFFHIMAVIESAHDERDLYAIKSLHFEQLRGVRGDRGERSARLNDQYRLILVAESDDQGRVLVVVGIEKHYR